MNGHLPSPADSASIAALGGTAVRMDFNWFDFQPTSGAPQFGYLDPIVQAARNNGLQIYATVAYTPQWASPLAGCDNNSSNEALKCLNKIPANQADWTNAVTAVVTRYKGQVYCWGIWNEPNLRTFFDGSLNDFVNQIFLPAAAAIRAADPTAKICGPELAGLTASSSWNGSNGTCAFGSCIRNGWEIDLSELLTRVGSHIDIITQHTYKADGAGVMKALLDGESFGATLTHDSIRHVIDTHGGAGKEFWLTETGWEHTPQGSSTEADVATRIVDLYAKQEEVCAGTYAGSTIDPWKNWTKTFYYHFPYDPGSGWGIVNSGNTPKQAYTALQTWAAGRTTTACTGVVVPVDAGVPDSGTPDAGRPDAGTDAGTSADAGTTDAGAVDAGAAADSGEPDAGGATDSGTVQADGGRPDGGVPGLDAQGGCGCNSAAPSVFALLAFAALALRRGRQGVERR
ncbi:MAG: GH39 family glycosyl hydrolase [Myxococcaceae bacterium]